MTSAASNKWSGLFSVGDELDDEDVLEADWTHTEPDQISASTLNKAIDDFSRSSQKNTVAVSFSLNGHAPSSDFLGQPDISNFNPSTGLRSVTNAKSSVDSQFVPHISNSTLRAPLGGCSKIPPVQQPSGSYPVQLTSPPPVCVTPQTKSLPQDDFDDWDVNLEELDEYVSMKDAPSATVCQTNSTFSAKRLRLSPGGGDTHNISSLRGFCATTPTSKPPQVFIRSPCPTTLITQRNQQPFVSRQSGSAGCFSSPLTPGPIRASPQSQRGTVTPRTEQRNTGSLFQAIATTPSPTHAPRPLHMPVLTNHLVQLVSAANKTPQKPRSNSIRPKMRRFPGPAGALPQQISERSLDEIVVTVPQTPAHGAVARLPTEVSNSQLSEEEEFSGGAWAEMKAEMGLDERIPSCFLHSYSIVMVLRKAALRQLPKNKVPNMAVILKSILHTHADAKAVFRDPTGEMQGTVHRRLLEDRQGELKTGAVLLLKQVGVFSPSYRNHYLNVTPNNLLRIYPADGAVHPSTQHSQPALQHIDVLPSKSSLPEGGPVSKMELHFVDEDEQCMVQPNATSGPPTNTLVKLSEDAQWDADDLDELLGELPVETYST